MPHAVNPASGWVGTTNHKTVSSDYPYYYSTFLASSHRQRRLIELMDAPSVADGGHGAMMRLRLPNAGTAETEKATDSGEDAVGRLATSSETSTNETATREAAS